MLFPWQIYDLEYLLAAEGGEADGAAVHTGEMNTRAIGYGREYSNLVVCAVVGCGAGSPSVVTGVGVVGGRSRKGMGYR